MFADVLKDLRLEKNCTQKEVAAACNVSTQCISSLEMGTRNPTGSTLSALADFFHVSIDYLLSRCDEAGTEIMQSENFFDTSPLEQRLILDFRKLPPNMQDNFVTLFHNLAMGA